MPTVGTSEDMVNLPRYRESLLEQFPLEEGGQQEARGPRKKWWIWRKKQRPLDVGHTPSRGTSSSVMITSVAMEDLDSGLATMRSEYSHHSNDSTKT